MPDSDAKVATVYEVAEWGFLRGNKSWPRIRQATATLVGKVQAGAAICPIGNGSSCDITVLASDHVDLTSGHGPVEGEFFVLEQLDNPVDGPELVIREGRLVNAVINLAPALSETAPVPVGYLCGQWVAKGSQLRGNLTGMFQLPFVFPPLFPVPNYVVDPAKFPGAGCCELVKEKELSLGTPTVKLILYLSGP